MITGISSSGYTPQPPGVAGPNLASQMSDAFREYKSSTPPSSQAAPVYYSPAIQIDRSASMAIYVQRNADTGEVINQYPSKAAVAEYQKVAAEKLEALRNFQTQVTENRAGIGAKEAVKEKPAAPEVAVAQAKQPTPPPEREDITPVETTA